MFDEREGVRRWLRAGFATGEASTMLPIEDAAAQMGCTPAFARDLAVGGVLDHEVRQGELFVRPVILRLGRRA